MTLSLLFWFVAPGRSVIPDLVAVVENLCLDTGLTTQNYCLVGDGGQCRFSTPPPDYVSPVTSARTVLRFDTNILNNGTGRTALAGLSDPPFFFATCGPDEYRLAQFTKHSVISTTSGSIAPGTSEILVSRCLTDDGCDEEEVPHFLGCAGPGLSPQCWSNTSCSQPCQWIDITNLTTGTYRLRVEINPNATFSSISESDYTNNVVYVNFTVADLPACNCPSSVPAWVWVLVALGAVCLCCSFLCCLAWICRRPPAPDRPVPPGPPQKGDPVPFGDVDLTSVTPAKTLRTRQKLSYDIY